MDILFDNRTLSELCGHRMTQEARCCSCVVKQSRGESDTDKKFGSTERFIWWIETELYAVGQCFSTFV